MFPAGVRGPWSDALGLLGGPRDPAATLRYEKYSEQPKIRCTPDAAATLVIQRRSLLAEPTPALGDFALSCVNNDCLGVLVVVDCLDHGPVVDTQHFAPHIDSQHAVSLSLFSNS